MFKNISTKGFSIWGALLLIFFYALLKILLAYSLLEIMPVLIDDSFLQIELGEFLSALIALLLFLFIFKKMIRTSERNYTPFPKVKLLLLLIFLAIGFRLLQDPFFHYKNIFFGKPPLSSSEIETTSFSLAILFKSIYIIFLLPILEELLFRKLIFKSLVKKYSSFWSAILVSSLLFSIIHLSLNNLIPTFLLGIIAAYIYYKTHNIWYPIFFHILLNLLWFAINLNPKPYQRLLEKLNFGIGYWLLVISGIGLIYLIKTQFQKLRLD